MKPNNHRTGLHERFKSAGKRLLEASLDRAADAARKQNLNDLETHAIAALATGTTSARILAKATGVATTDATGAMAALEQRGLAEPEPPPSAEPERRWQLTEEGLHLTREFMRPRCNVVRQPPDDTESARIQQAAQAIECAIRAPKPDD